MLQEDPMGSVRGAGNNFCSAKTRLPCMIFPVRPKASSQRSQTEVWPMPSENAHVMKCILNITRSDVKRRRFTLIRILIENFDKRERITSCHGKCWITLKCWLDRLASKMRTQACSLTMGNVAGTLKGWFGRLTSKMRRRDKFFNVDTNVQIDIWSRTET